MNHTSRSIAAGIGAIALALGLSVGAQAQTYPSQRITFVVGFAAGGFADTVARLVGDHVGKTLKQPVIVENRAGAGSNIAARAVASAKPDGYTVLVSTTGAAINASLYKKLDYSITNDLVPVAISVVAPETFSVPSSRPQTLKAFIDAAKTKKMVFGSAGVGTGSHLTMFSFFKSQAKVDVEHVPFQGGAPAQQAAVGGQIDGLAATASGSVVSQLSAGGALTCLGVAAPKRYALLPNCPTFAEQGFPNAVASSWVGFWVPKGTPDNVIAALNKAINSISDDAKAVATLKQNGELTGFNPAQAADFVKKEVDAWAIRVKDSGAQID
jgi:tripartite-type tricarboxylate transporter receptor subunit TctC